MLAAATHVEGLIRHLDASNAENVATLAYVKMCGLSGTWTHREVAFMRREVKNYVARRASLVALLAMP